MFHCFRISYLEIYNEQMYDLLSPQPFMEGGNGQQIAIGEDENGVYVKGLSSHLAQTEEEALNLLFEVITLRARCVISNRKERVGTIGNSTTTKCGSWTVYI